MPLVAARAWRLQPELVLWLGAIAAAWAAAYWLEASGVSHVLHHHTIFHSGQIATGGLALLGAWQVMTAAMMLPGALPAVRRVGSQHRLVIVLVEYFAAWTAFAAAAFVADMALHALVHAWTPAAQHENLIPAALLGIAAAYQLTPWKRDSLEACRHSAAGLSYALNCVASGWALMLLMFSAGVANLAWMAALTLAILAEKTLASPDAVRRVIALALAVLAVASLA
jgi:predicted metal-binding membrane protein